MALPELSPEQRQAALDAAREARAARARIAEALRLGSTSVGDVFARADAEPDGPVAKMKIKSVLKALPGVGDKRVESLLSEAGIAETRRIKGVGPKQRATLIGLLKATSTR